MATFADLLSLSTSLECDGKTYPIREPNQLEQGKFQRFLEEKAFSAVERMPFREEAARAAALNALTRDTAAGAYEWRGDVASRAILSEDGMSKLLELICEIPPDEAKKVVATHINRVIAIMTAAENSDPKAMALALQALGLKPDFISGKPSLKSETRHTTRRKPKSKR